MVFARESPLPRSVASQSLSFMPGLLAYCQLMSIAKNELCEIADCYPIKAMKTSGQIRRENLVLLLDRQGSAANLNERLDLPRTDATLSQIKNQSLAASGKGRMMGDMLARRIERALELPEGWMDNDQAPLSYRQQRIEHAIKAMEGMAEYQLDQAIQIIDTLAQPAPGKNGTED